MKPSTLLLTSILILVQVPQFALAQWDAPANYYSGVNGVGATLKDQLRAAMTNGHIERRYGDFRDSAAIHDQDPDNPANIILNYDRGSVSAPWDSGQTWNREHVWPQSRQPGSASNSSRGNLGDPFALRPIVPSINSSRGNKPFGLGDTVGDFGSLGTYWYPGDICTGDVARSLFYSETRWSSLGLELVNGVPTGNQMGDLASLIQWHYLDPPDEFERRRNHTIFSSEFNPNYFTNNRNAFIDRPEFVWSIYVDQANDSMISINGGSDNGSGSSTFVVDFGSVIVGQQIPTNQSITLNKTGDAGTYFMVELTGMATSNVEGHYNAFAMNGPSSRTIDVTLDYDPNAAAIYDGLVLIDNLDVTTQGGAGRGANDGDDIIGLGVKVVEHSNASFSGTANLDSLTIDLGEVPANEPIQPVSFDIFNLASASGADLTASLVFQSIDESPTDGFLSIDGPLFADLSADQSQTYSIVGTPSQLGSNSTTFELTLSDEAIPGSTTQTLTISVDYEVVVTFVLGDVNCDGVTNLLDIGPFIEVLGSGTYSQKADINQDGSVNTLDIDPFVELIGS